MRKIKLYIAISLNGKIAKSDGSVDWLELIPKPKDDDYGYSDFHKNIDTTIQGYSTYNQIMGWKIDFPYEEKEIELDEGEFHKGKSIVIRFVGKRDSAR